MLFLRNNLAKNDVHVARFYIRRGAYVAAANRAKYVVERYPRSTAVRDALEIMAEAYRRLGLTDLEADAMRVLAYNEERGNFVDDTPAPDELSLGQQIWDYFQFEQD